MIPAIIQISAHPVASLALSVRVGDWLVRLNNLSHKR